MMTLSNWPEMETEFQAHQRATLERTRRTLFFQLLTIFIAVLESAYWISKL